MVQNIENDGKNTENDMKCVEEYLWRNLKGDEKKTKLAERRR